MAGEPNFAYRIGQVIGALFMVLVALLGAALLAWPVWKLITAFSPSIVQVSLSIDFADESGPSIRGRATVDGEPVESGRVKLSARRLLPPLRVSILEAITNGEFTVSESPALAAFKRDDGIFVDAEVEIRRAGKTIRGGESAAWNMGRWLTWVPWVVLGGSLGLAIWLAVLFTGNFTPLKNRMAISLTYLAITVFLLIPFLMPFLLDSLPGSKQLLSKSPVGFVEVGKAGRIELNQWALNIGGMPKQIEETGPYQIDGGLVIPLYVLVLATLGGAINMTRKVPDLQRDIDVNLNAVFSVKRTFAMVFGGSSAAPGGPALGGSSMAETESDPQEAINKLRGDLINQYMYLITAPFLAIVVYYLLSIIEPKLVENTPIVVVMSFSAGLTSEPFLRTITSYADKYLARLAKDTSASEGEAPRKRIRPAEPRPRTEPASAGAAPPAEGPQASDAS